MIEFTKNHFLVEDILCSFDPLIERWNSHFSPLILSIKLCQGFKLLLFAEKLDPVQ
jgi:hypothetical protein